MEASERYRGQNWHEYRRYTTGHFDNAHHNAYVNKQGCVKCARSDSDSRLRGGCGNPCFPPTKTQELGRHSRLLSLKIDDDFESGRGEETKHLSAMASGGSRTPLDSLEEGEREKEMKTFCKAVTSWNGQRAQKRRKRDNQIK